MISNPGSLIFYLSIAFSMVLCIISSGQVIMKKKYSITKLEVALWISVRSLKSYVCRMI